MKKHITPTALKLMVELYVEAINKAKKNGAWRQRIIGPYNPTHPIPPKKVLPPIGREIIFFDFKKD